MLSLFEGSRVPLMLADKGSGESAGKLKDTVNFVGRRFEQPNCPVGDDQLIEFTPELIAK